MITLESYRICIGCFSSRLFSTTAFIKRSYRNYYNDIFFMNRFFSAYCFLKYVSVRLTTVFLFALLILLLCGDIESNPGPYTILKSVQGSFHQGDPKLGKNVGTQCVCNSLFAIVWSAVKNVSIWNTGDVNLVLYEGTKLYGSLGYTNQYLSVDDIRNQIFLENEVIQIQNLENTTHVLKDENNDSVLYTAHLSNSDQGHGMLCIISGVSFSIIWGNSSVYLFDPHSRDIRGQITDNGRSVLLKFQTLHNVESYIKEVYVPQGQEMYLETQYFRIITTEEVTRKIRLSIGKKRKLDSNRKYNDSERGQEKQRESRNKYTKTEQGKAKENESKRHYKKTDQGKAKQKECAVNYKKTDQGKTRQKEWAVNYKKTDQGKTKQKEWAVNYKKTDQGKAKQKTSKVKYEKKVAKEKEHHFNLKINEFKKCIKNGPLYICVICNRSLYKRSVKLFHKNDYTRISEENFRSRV